MGHLTTPAEAERTDEVPTMTWYRWDAGDLCLTLKVQPRAKRDAFVGPLGECYRVQITAPPVDGKANAHLRRFLAETFGVTPSGVELDAGALSRTKRVRIRNPRRLAGLVPAPSDPGQQADGRRGARR